MEIPDSIQSVDFPSLITKQRNLNDDTKILKKNFFKEKEII